jgi:HSP20 family protein
MAYRSGFPFGPTGNSGMFDLRREIDRLFEDAFGTQGGGQGALTSGGNSGGSGGRTSQARSFTPAVDAREEQDAVVLHMDLPGVRPEDVDISVENGLLTVRGQRHQQRKEGQEGRYQFVERSYGSFYRAFQLPQGVDESQIKADFEHGELTIQVPKPALPQPRKVQISSGRVSGQGQPGAQPGGQQGGQPGGQPAGQGSTQVPVETGGQGTPAGGSATSAASGAPDQGARDM